MNNDFKAGWDSYYKRTVTLPEPEFTRDFLRYIPENGKILDFGTGTGRWAAAFSRDRDDLVIDVLDQNIEKAALLANDWRGKKIKSSFQDFVPSKKYNGIWSFAALFFLNNYDIRACFSKLSDSLCTGGILSFTMVDDCDAAHEFNVFGLSKPAILDLLDSQGLKVVSIALDENAIYGERKITIATFSVIALKS